jgi:hypothetical protein
VSNEKLLLQLLHQRFRKGSQSSDRKGILILSTLFYCLLLIRKLSCRVPQDIPSATPAKNIPPESKSPKVDKPLSPSAEKTFLEMSNPADPEDIHLPTSAASNPTSPLIADSRCDTADPSPRPDSTVHREASPISPESFRLRAHRGPQPSESSFAPRPKKQPQKYSCIAEFLWDNSEFIQGGLLTGRYVSASMNTQAEQEQIKALHSSMKTTSELIDVSFYPPLYFLTLRPNSSLIQEVVKHSRDKNQFLRVSLKRMQENQMYETELKEANEYNSTLFAWLKELEAKCTKENQSKEGTNLLPFCPITLSYPSILWIDHDLYRRI